MAKSEVKFEGYHTYREYPPQEMIARSEQFLAELRRRRSVRQFSPRPLPREVIENCLLAAGTAPSGANRQPWHFVVVTDSQVKHEIRIGAEKEEVEFYQRRAPEDFLEDLRPFDVNEQKPFLETAPCLIVIFSQSYLLDEAGEKIKHYYVNESIGIATGMLITALHHAGLATLTHTPSPMKFLNQILGRPPYEHPFLILVAGYPAEDARLPVITKKSLAEIATFLD